MTTASVRRIGAITVCVFGIVLGSVRCADNGPSTPTRLETKNVARSVVSPDSRARASAARAKMAWVGDFHSEVVRDFIKTKKSLAGPRKATKAAKCDAVGKLLNKYLPRVSAHLPITPEVIKVAKAELAKHGCEAPAGLDAFVTSSTTRAADSEQLSLFATLSRQEPTGVFEQYAPALEAVWDGASTPQAIEAASSAVVDQAATDGIPQADLEIVAALASVNTSSGYEWYAHGQTGGFDEPSPDAEMSLFYQGDWLPKFKTVGKCDLLGALVGALLGGLGGALVGGFVASVACLAFL